MASSFGGTVKLTGESEYRSALKNITSELKIMSQQMVAVAKSYSNNEDDINSLTEKNRILNKEVELQASKLINLNGMLEENKKKYGEDSSQVQILKEKINLAHIELDSMNKKLEENSNALNKAKQNTESYDNANKTSINNVRDFTAELLKSVAGASNLGQTLKNDLTIRVNDLKENINSSKEKISNFGSTIADTVKHPSNLGNALKEKLIDTAEKLQSSVKGDANAIKDIGTSADDAGTKTLKLGDLIKANLISDFIKAGISEVASGIKKLGSACIDIGKQSLESFGNYEQLIGGVETLFKDSAGTVQEYANNAYKTAGLSANEYMSTVTSFSTSLLQSLNGDTEKSAQVADMAITDMSDNANKMGTSMEMIQNAYQGFAKQNYTMLDNLKLGYGGTKTEMERLLSDAEKVTGIKYDISNLNDVYQAIHVIQGELGITGTTAKEASSTIQGSASAMKSAWQNLLTGIANGDADFNMLVNNFVDSVITAGENVLPRIEEIFSGIGNLITDLLPVLMEKVLPMGIELINSLVTGITSNFPAIVSSISSAMTMLINGIQQVLPQITTLAFQIISQLANTLIANLPQILETGIQILLSLIDGLVKTIPDLIPTIVQAVITIVETLIDHLDELIDAGIQIIFALVDGIIEALPDLIDKMPELIDKVVKALSDNLPKIIQAGITLTIKIAEGLIKAIPKLVAKIPQIIGSIVSGFGNYVKNMWDVGLNLVKGIWDGISNSLTWIKDKIKGWVGNVTKFIKKLFGINSPSRLFRDEIGTNLALGLGEGFTNTMGDVTEKMANAIPTEFDTSVNANINTPSSSVSTFDSMVSAFKTALSDVKVVMNDREMGTFITDTIEEVVYS